MKNTDHDRAEEARRTLERVRGEDAGLFGHAQGAADAVRERFDDGTQQDDWAELWGKRIGRGMGLVFVTYLVWHLVTTYIMN